MKLLWVILNEKNGASCLFLDLNFSGHVSDREYVQFSWNRISWANSTASFMSICLSNIFSLYFYFHLLLPHASLSLRYELGHGNAMSSVVEFMSRYEIMTIRVRLPRWKLWSCFGKKMEDLGDLVKHQRVRLDENGDTLMLDKFLQCQTEHCQCWQVVTRPLPTQKWTERKIDGFLVLI